MILQYASFPLELRVGQEIIDFNINEDINIDRVRKQFNKLISHYSFQYHNDIHYWMLKISERNTLVSSLFQDICFLLLIEKYHRKYGNELIVFTNNIALYCYFKGHPHCHIDLSSRFRFRLSIIRSISFSYLKILRFLMIWTGRHFLARMTRKKCVDIALIEESCVLQTWTSHSNWANHQYQEGYFGDLAQKLEDSGKKVIIWPILFNNANYSKAFSVMRKNPSRFLLMEDVLNYFDYVMAIFYSLKKRGKYDFSHATILDEERPSHPINISALFICHTYYEGMELGSLMHYFFLRLSERGLNKIKIIYLFENMISEKGLILGVRKWIKDAKLIGYFHSSKPKNLLCLEYASPEEYNIAPKPDCIIFNSNHYSRYYQTLYPSLRLKAGYAFKQKYLQQISPAKDNHNFILILFSGNENDIHCMADFLNKNKEVLNPYKLVIKTHPMVQTDLSRLSMPVTVSSAPLNVLLPKADKVIATYSSALLDAFLYGKPLAFLYSKQYLLLNPFDDTGIGSYWLIKNREDLIQFLLNATPVERETSPSDLFNFEPKHYSAFIEEIA